MDFDNKIEVFCRYIKRNGKKIYPKNGSLFHFFVDADNSPKTSEPNSDSTKPKN